MNDYNYKRIPRTCTTSVVTGLVNFCRKAFFWAPSTCCQSPDAMIAPVNLSKYPMGGIQTHISNRLVFRIFLFIFTLLFYIKYNHFIKQSTVTVHKIQVFCYFFFFTFRWIQKVRMNKICQSLPRSNFRWVMRMSSKY